MALNKFSETQGFPLPFNLGTYNLQFLLEVAMLTSEYHQVPFSKEM